MKTTEQDNRDIWYTINILESMKDSLDGLKNEDTYYDAIEVAVLWLERIIKENENEQSQ